MLGEINQRNGAISSVEDVPLGLAEAAIAIGAGRNGRPTSPNTLARWIKSGVRLRDGSRTRLKARRQGHRFVTTRRFIAEFFDTLTAASLDGIEAGPSPRTPAQLARDAGAAADQLEAEFGV